MVDFRSLESFVWIARLGSFRAAADKLNAAQPSVSARIAKLEQELGVQLFDRSARNVTLTSKGRVLLDYAERLLGLRASMLSAVADISGLGGTIRMGAAETIVHTWLPRLIERIHKHYPGVTLELEVDTSLNLRDGLVNRGLDIAFLLGPVSQPTVQNRPLCHYPLAWVASPRLGLPRDGAVTLDTLANWPIITYPRLSRPYIAIQDMMHGLPGRRPRIYGSSSLATIVRMTLDGIGISAIPPRIVREELASGALHLVETDAAATLPGMDFTVSWQAQADTPLARAIAEAAIETAAGDAEA
ncbi:LysR family transcriptional regulator [Tistrella mobilis]|uniref:LysR family transcriptional regulator n=1 Tax=Tistrella mobilis (strain KA081020-065) TaxID=1110502 RepID=I3TK06_TISMK|nr:LysR family transcriptional regulator [Tistrella mobilis]AFK53094.1 LysR family transcriptional regulator [Tistrella mobilis KA081020-065]